jgi:hypothetical protein
MFEMRWSITNHLLLWKHPVDSFVATWNQLVQSNITCRQILSRGRLQLDTDSEEETRW